MLTGSASSQTTIREAREIIAKWSSSDLLEQISAFPEIPAMPAPHFKDDRPASPAESAEGATVSEETSADSSQPDQQEQGRQPSKPAEEQATVLPAAELPATETPATELPATETPATETPATETPATETPATELPATELPATETPVAASDNDARQKVTTPVEQKADSRPLSGETTGETTVLTQESTGPTGSRIPAESGKSGPGRPELQVVVESRSSKSEPPTTPVSPANSESRQRRLQKRNEQRRKQRSRKAPAIAENKGQAAVKRKLRVDSHNAEQQESATSEPSRNVAGGQIQSNSPQGGRRHRIDAGEAVDLTLDTGDARRRTQTRPRQRFIDEPHSSGVRGPHFQVTAPRRSNLTSLTGQFLAYIGVLGLTIGTAMVIYGHFGGYSQYTPTGWLVTTVAQMMLFLGVINLVSGGIEQNNDDVSARINHLGDQLMRIEQVTEEVLRGPKIDPQRYADPNAPVEESRQEAMVYAKRE